MERSVILLFIKYPEPGKVKTRFAAEAGQDAALVLYRLLVDRVMKIVTRCQYPFRICFSPATAGDAFAFWLGPDHRYQPQQGGDLGERMKTAFQKVFSEGVERALLIGSDVPGLGPEIVEEAFQVLDDCDVVIGPARDGGYYMIGFTASSFKPEVFDKIPWSTNAVYAATCRIMKAAELRIHCLPLLRDIDTLQDLKEYILEAGDRPGASLDPLRLILDSIERSLVADRLQRAIRRDAGTS